jgi:hypothetical protein
MDGVLADFDRYVLENLGRVFTQNGPDDDVMWAALEKVADLYSRFEAMEHANALVSLACKLAPKVEILTAIPRRIPMPRARQDKIDWAAARWPGLKVNFGPYSRDKWKHAKPGDILVDDLHTNIRDWINKGFGIGIHYTDFNSAAIRLHAMVNERNRFR